MRITWMLLALSACADLADTVPLSKLPPPEIFLTASLDDVWVGIGNSYQRDRACGVLDNAFVATLNGTAMQIVRRGAAVDAPEASEPCESAAVELMHPGAARPASIAIQYPEHAITIDLEDLLAARAATLAPDRPWVFVPGEQITLAWTPVTDLEIRRPEIVYRRGAGDTADPSPPIVLAGNKMTFALPTTGAADRIDIVLRRDDAAVHELPCQGAHCLLGDSAAFTHAIAWK